VLRASPEERKQILENMQRWEKMSPDSARDAQRFRELRRRTSRSVGESGARGLQRR